MTVPAPPTASTTPAPTPRTAWSRWNTWYKLSGLAGGSWIAYVVATCTHWVDPNHDPVPRPINAIILTGLSLATIMSFLAGWRLDCRTRERIRDAEDREWRQKVLGAIAELKRQAEAKPTGDETTVNLTGRNTFRPEGRVLYASLMGIHNGPMDLLMEAVGNRVDKAVAGLSGQIKEYGNQRWYAGYAARAEESDSGGTVRPLTPRNGHRPAN